MQRHLGSAIQSNIDETRSGPDRCITDHFIIAPRTLDELPRARSFGQEWNATWKTDLTAMGMTAQNEIETSIGRIAVGLRGV